MVSKFEIFIDVFIGIFILVGLVTSVSIDIGNSYQEITGGILPTLLKCKDTDSGDHYKKGTCTDSKGSYTDYCSTGKWLVEYLCSPYNNCVKSNIQCDSGCSNGACVKPTTTTTSKTTTTIPKCTDSDSGDHYKKGTCTDSKGSYTDYCSTGQWLVEYFCSPYNDCRESRTQCSSGCSDGACVKPATITTTTTIPSPGSDICSSRKDCSSCTYWVYYAHCGWCKNLNQCKHGTQAGPDDGSCSGSDWIRYKNDCPISNSCYAAGGVCQSNCASNQENLGKMNCYIVCCR